MKILSTLFSLFLFLFLSFTYSFSQNTPFITEWETTSTNESITIKTSGSYTYDYTVDWGDGNIETGLTGNATHTYASAGTHVVSITGIFPYPNFGSTGSYLKLKKITQWGDIAWEDFNSSFFDCQNLVVTATDAPDLSLVTNLSFMFYNCPIDQFSYNALANWDVSTITNMGGLFRQQVSLPSSGSLNLDLSSWDVSNVTSMAGMFARMGGNVDANMDNWDVSSVTTMEMMFTEIDNGYLLDDISGWNTPSLENMYSMFGFSEDMNVDISNWDVSNVTNMSDVFYGNVNFDYDLSNWDIGNVTTLDNAFTGTALSTANYDNMLIAWAGLPSLQSNVHLGAGSTTYCAFNEHYILTNTYGWNITDGGVDSGCSNGFITEWETTSSNESITIKTSGSYTYDYTIDWGDGNIEYGLTGDATHTYASAGTHVVSIAGIFPYPNFGTSGSYLKLKKITQWGDIAWESFSFSFNNCQNLVVTAIDAPDLSLVTDLTNMFYNCPIDQFPYDALANWEVSTITNMSNLFAQQSSTPNSNGMDLDLSSWDVSNVTSMAGMFAKMGGFVSANMANWDVSSVTTMAGMFEDFQYTGGLIDDISGWNTANLVNMSAMFAGSYNMTEDISNWDVSNVTNMAYLFSSNVDWDYDLSNWDIGNVTTLNNAFAGTALSTANYDNMLIAWSGLPTLQSNVNLGAGNATFCDGYSARKSLTDTYGWNITDGGLANGCSSAFITEWETTGANESITIKTSGSYTYDYAIDWGDGNIEYGLTGDATHNYASAGTHIVRIIGIFPTPKFGQSGSYLKLKKITQWGDIAWESFSFSFFDCQNLVVTATDAPDLSLVTSLSDMFRNCPIDQFPYDALANWDVSTITDMTNLFKQDSNSPSVTGMNLDLSNWDVSNVTNMGGMFSGMKGSMFANMDNWDVSNVTSMAGMFGEFDEYGIILDDISGWNTASLVNMSGIFAYSNSMTVDISNWDVSNVTNMANLFSNNEDWDYDLSNWDIGNVTTLNNAFAGTSLSIANYENMLIAWSGLPTLQSNVNLGAGNATYCTFNEHYILTNTYSWNITDGGVDSGCTNGFITEWQTTGANESITIPTTGSGFDYTIDWGDGNITTGTTGNPSHVYATPGTYQVQVFGSFPRIYFNGYSSNGQKLKKILQWGEIAWTSMENAFYDCTEMALVASDAPDLSNVTSLHGMFRGCYYSSFSNTTFVGWDVSTITNMSYMFAEQDAGSMNKNIGDWDVSNVTDMSYLFLETDVFTGTNIGNWDVSSVQTMEGMFHLSNSVNPNMGNWNVQNVTNMSKMFDSAYLGSGLGLSNWNVSSVTDMSYMFYFVQGSFQWDFTNWDVSNVTNMSNMFFGAPEIPVGIENWDVSSVTNMKAMLSGINGFNTDLSNWDVSSVTDMGNMFAYSNSFDQDLSTWDVSSVTDMGNMFRDATAFDQDLSNWDVSNVTDMSFMFLEAGLSTANYDATLIGWAALPNLQSNVNFHAGSSQYCALIERQHLIDTYGWTITDGGIAPGCAQSFITEWETTGANESITIPTTGSGFDYTIDWGDSTITSGNTGSPSHVYATPGTYQVQIFGSFPRIYFNGNSSNSQKLKKILQWGEIAWTSMENAFYGCSNMALTATDAPDLSNVTSLHGMFRGCHYSLFSNTTFAGWDVSTITDLSYMFAEQHSGSMNINIGGWDVSNVTDMSYMFWYTDVLYNTNIGNWDVSSVTTMEGMFHLSTVVNNTNLGNWNVQGVTNMSKMFDSAYLYPGLGLSNWDVSNVTNMSSMFYFVQGSFQSDFTNWDVSNVTNMAEMFFGVPEIPVGIENWDVSSVTNMRAMLSGINGFNTDLSTWDVSSVTDMGNMFSYSSAFDQDLSTWDVSSVTDMEDMFSYATAFDQDLSSWDVSNVTDMSSMFLEAGLSTANYDATLIAWAALPSLQSNVNFHAGSSQYCYGHSARQSLIDTYSWVITDGGPDDQGLDNDGDNYTVCQGDCDDSNPDVYPGAPELPCNGIDDNCNGEIDENYALPTAICQDVIAYLDEFGSATILPEEVNNGSVDVCGNTNLVLSLDQTTFDCSHVGQENIVTLTVTDDFNGQATCTANVTVMDLVAPTAVCHPNITVQLDQTGNGSITAEEIDNGSSDACGIASLSLDQTSFDCSHVGDQTVTLTVTDVNGNVSTCSATVTVEDNIAPVASCQNITVQLDESGNGSITAEEIDNGSSVACGIASLSLDQTSFDCSHVGDQTVTLTVTDVNGNVNTCSATVTVEDNIAPVASCQSITVQLDESGNGSITAEEIDNGSNDACGIASLSLDQTTFDCSHVGDQTVTLTVTDVNGNVSTCSATVTVEDNIAPVASCQSITVQLDESGNGSITAEEIDNGSSDACGIASLSLDQTTFDCSHVGNQTVTLTVTDVNGNVSTCSATVTVEDNIAPVASCQNITVQLDANGQASISEDAVNDGSSDACGILSYDTDITSFDCNTLGDIMVTLTVEDVNGNTNQCTATVTVVDEVIPAINCPSDIIVSADPGLCSAIVNYTAPVGTDNCEATTTLTSGLGSGSTFPVGTTTETYTVTDGSGNTASCSFTVTVNDTEAPEVTSDLFFLNCVDDENSDLYEVDFTVTDNCDNNPTVLSVITIPYIDDPTMIFKKKNKKKLKFNLSNNKITVEAPGVGGAEAWWEQIEEDGGVVVALEQQLNLTEPDDPDKVIFKFDNSEALTKVFDNTLTLMVTAEDISGNSTSDSYTATQQCGGGDQNQSMIDNNPQIPVENTLAVNGLKVFPNPTSDFVNVQLNEHVNEGELQVFDQLGRLVFQDNIFKEETLKTIPVHQFPEGIYTLIILSDNQRLTEKFIVQKFN